MKDKRILCVTVTDGDVRTVIPLYRTLLLAAMKGALAAALLFAVGLVFAYILDMFDILYVVLPLIGVLAPAMVLHAWLTNRRSPVMCAAVAWAVLALYLLNLVAPWFAFALVLVVLTGMGVVEYVLKAHLTKLRQVNGERGEA